jgi:hypothetical protein
MLIKTTEALMEYTSVSADLDFNLIKPFVKMAEKRFILPVLGTAFYDEVQQAVNTGNATFDRLVDYINSVTAPIAVWYYTQVGGTTIDSSGIYKPKNSTRWNLGDREQTQLETAFLNNGIDALDDLLNYLDDKKDDYETYKNSSEYQAERNSLIPSAKVVQEVFTLLHPRVTFRAMREAIRHIESTRIAGIMQDYYSNLLVKAESALTPEDKLMRGHARRALIYLSTARALLTRTVKLTAEGLEVIIADGKTVSQSENPRIEAAAREYGRSGEFEIAALISLMKQHLPTGYLYVAPTPLEDTGRPIGIHFF